MSRPYYKNNMKIQDTTHPLLQSLQSDRNVVQLRITKWIPGHKT